MSDITQLKMVTPSTASSLLDGSTPNALSSPELTDTGQMTSTEQSAWAQVEQTLQQYGFTGTDLTNLSNFVQQQLIAGNSTDQITLNLQQTPEFAARFPAIIERQQAGLPPVSPAEYIANEASYEQLERAAGIPPNFASYDELIAADVSPTEYAARINQGYLAVSQADPTVVNAFQDYYGVSKGQLAAYFLDPTKAEPMLQQQAVAAQIGGASAQSGFGQVTSSEAQRLAQMNVTYSQAQQGFATLAKESQVTGSLPGQGQTALSQDQILNAQFGSDGLSQQQITANENLQKGYFSQGSQVGATSSGAQGAGVIQR